MRSHLSSHLRSHLRFLCMGYPIPGPKIPHSRFWAGRESGTFGQGMAKKYFISDSLVYAEKGPFSCMCWKKLFLDEISREILSDNLFLQQYYLNEISGNFISSLQYYRDEISPEISPEILCKIIFLNPWAKLDFAYALVSKITIVTLFNWMRSHLRSI